MKKKLQPITGKVPRVKRRAIELFADTRFFEKKEVSKKVYSRKRNDKRDIDRKNNPEKNQKFRGFCLEVNSISATIHASQQLESKFQIQRFDR